MTSQVKELVPLSLLNIAAGDSKVSSSLKTTRHKVFSFWYHINKIHTQINHLAVIAKIISQPGIQLCVASVADQTDCHGLHERHPYLVKQTCLIWIHIILVTRQRIEKYSSYIMVQWSSHQPVFRNRRHCCVSACSPTVWLQDYTEGKQAMFLMTVL
jgi:hypothetical protein